ncbi:MAG: hypothetical protein M0Z41_01605 [Peptococcaceae bacterium]|nr:hypothetical protein [Peptococcaceae bacterium]
MIMTAVMGGPYADPRNILTNREEPVQDILGCADEFPADIFNAAGGIELEIDILDSEGKSGQDIITGDHV